jgi:hypothetical protein
MSGRQRIAMVLCAALVWILAAPFLEDVTDHPGASLGEVPFLVIGLSVAMGMLAAMLDPDATKTMTLDVVRRRMLWVGVGLLPVAWLGAAFLA